MAEYKGQLVRPKAMELLNTHKGFSSSPGCSDVTLKIAANLKIPDPMQNKYRSPNTSLDSSPAARARSSAPPQKSTKQIGVASHKPSQITQAILKDDNLRRARKADSTLSFIDLMPRLLDENATHKKSKDTSLRTADDELSRMDYLVKKYKRDITDQTTQMQVLRRTVQSYDLKIEKLVKEKAEERVSASYDHLLKQKDQEIAEWKDRLERLETEVEARFSSQIKGLEVALTGYKVAVKDLEEEGRRLKARVHDLESLSDVSAADLIKNERDELKVKTAELSRQLVSASSVSSSAFKQLEGTIHELEEMQLRLLTENNQLKEELIGEQRRMLSVRSR
jgi:chromosome segregation ATPase